MFIYEVFTLVLVSFGNFQIPAATVRVVLPLLRLDNCPTQCDATPSPAPAQSSCDPCNPAMVNLAPSLYIFYGMVLGQGALFAVACVLEIFSTIPRRSLVRRGGFKGQSGVDSVKLYYAYALEKCLERNVFAPKISLCSFAIDSLDSDSTKRQIHGIRTAHILLQMEPTRTRLLVKLNAPTNTMTRLMSMLHWAGQENDTIRLFAAKVVDEIAESLLVVTIPGIIQNVSLLLGCGNQRKGGNPLLDTDGGQEQQNDDLFVAVDAIDGHNESGDTVPDTANLLQTQDRRRKGWWNADAFDSASDRSTQPSGNNEHNCWCWIARWCRQVSEFCTVPQEGPLTEHDLLPVLGMSIIERLAAYDQSNCEEISKMTGLISKITRFTRLSTSNNTYTDAEKKVLVQSSLKLFQRHTSIDGEIGVTLRRTVSNHPFLLRNLSEILGNMTSCHEPRKLAAEVLRNLAVDDNTRQKIGRVQRIIARLMQAFLAPDLSSCTDGDRLLSKVAGQALAMMAMGNADNCRAMLRETGYSFIEKLADMIISFDSHRCVAASLLRSMRMHVRDELAVQERILRAEGAELEIFIDLSSHIYEAIPKEFAQDFECVQIKENFVKHLVSALKTANREPNADCPGIRRVIVEQAIKLMEYDHPRNINCFRDLGTTEELLTVEETISDDENYTIFMGDVGLMEAGGEPLSLLVARAKQLMADGPMAQSSSSGAVEHRVRMPAAHVVVAAAGRADEQGKRAGRPEMLLNCFVRFLVLIERAGNALGTLAFTWATVVLLGGYPTVLAHDDFWFATIIIFLEALRMFGPNNRSDYQLFFHTRGALKPLGWSGLIIIVFLSNVWNYTLKLLDTELSFVSAYLLLILQLVAPGLFQSSRSLQRLSQRLYHAISLWSPLVAILLMIPLIFTSKNKVANWIVFSILFLTVLLLTGRRLANQVMGNKQVFWRRLVLNLCMIVSLVMLIFMPNDPGYKVLVFVYELYALVLVSFGSLQIPAAATRVVLSLLRLTNQNDYYKKNDDNNVHLRSTLNIFYGMVLGQGTLYVVACILEVFSFIPRRRLARRGGFGGQFGVESVTLYYAYALEKSMEGDVLGPKKTDIISFTMHCLDSDMPKMQFHGIRTMQNLLRREETRPRALSRLTTSAKTWQD
ncbi:hypothetical protein U9M48_016032 [Paspalum notatum var. saurae]|uniref:BLE2 protein n=1 Tax=Paspalum notatum var. saurae TaxID=547442 RepID=A0AAQ3T4P2_PASNO